MATHESRVRPDNRKATEVFVALRYWARASGYVPTEAEKQVLTACEARANRQWATGVVVGSVGGFVLGTRLKLPMIQRSIIASAAAAVGSLYGQYASNGPCLCELLDMATSSFGEESSSPLAAQAREILRVGGPETVRSLQRAASDSPRLTPGQALAGDSALQRDRREATPWEAAVSEKAEGAEEGEEETSERGATRSIAAQVARGRPATGPSSWEEVRARYEARKAGGVAEGGPAHDGPSPLGDAPPAHPPRVETGGAPWRAAAPEQEPPPAPAGLARRSRKNAYGDEVFDEGRGR